MTTNVERNDNPVRDQEQQQYDKEEDEQNLLVDNSDTTSPTTTTTSTHSSPPYECEYQIGDHIYQWCSFIGIPAVFQHHGIVLNCYWKDGTNITTTTNNDNNDSKSNHSDGNNNNISDVTNDGNNNGEWILQIADFSNVDHHYQEYQQQVMQQQQQQQQLQQPQLQHDNNTTAIEIGDETSVAPASTTSLTNNRVRRSFGRSPSKASYSVRTYEVSVPPTMKKKSHFKKKKNAQHGSSGGKWHKVLYNANWWQRQTYRTGTCTSASSDPPGLVRARVQFLIDHPELLPKYDAITANCECVAVWCKTGTWATLQAINWLIMTAAGQVKSAVTIGSVVAATNVTAVVPASGFWGWMGYTTTTTVPLMATQPYLIPAIIGYGCITVAAPTVWLLHAKHHAKRTTELLNTTFWEQAIDQPEIFVECITNWSTLYEPQRGCNNEEIITFEPRDNNAVTINDNVDINDSSNVDHIDVVEKDNATTEQSSGQQSLEQS